MNRSGLLLALALGCTPELEPIHWEPVDIAALREAIANPTGIVDEASTDEVAAAILERDEPYRALADYLHAVFASAESDDASVVWVLPQALSGTSVYVLVACPGPRDADDAPFRHGSMRIDSPTLDFESASSFAIAGQLLLSFDGCVIEEFVFDGSASAFRSSEPLELGFVPQIAWVEVGREHVHELREPVLWSASGRISALFELSSGDTLALDWTTAQTDLRLRGRNGALVCTVEGGALECVPP